MSANHCPECGTQGHLVESGGETQRTYTCEESGCGWNGEEWSVASLLVKPSKTGRGFQLFEFKDRYGEECTLQASSLATESAVWLGTAGRVAVFQGNKAPDGTWQEPWVEYPLPKDVLNHSRMHLTQQQVADLLPYLQHFAEHGRLPEEEL